MPLSTPKQSRPAPEQRLVLLTTLVVLGVATLIGAIILLGGGRVLPFLLGSTSSLPSPVLSTLMTPQGTPSAQNQPGASPQPYSQITIPHLRARTYQSQLEERTPAYQRSKYEAYTTWYDSDGLRINALLTIPTTPAPQSGYPAVVFIHGYIPPTQYQTLGNYESYVDYLAQEGIVVLKIDLRGHGDSEGTASGAYYSGDYIIDALNAYAALENEEIIDPQQIGLWGHSMAGNVVLRSLAARPSIPKAVIWAGAVYTYQDFAELGISDNSYRPPSILSERRRDRDELFETHGRFDSSSEFWQQVPATNYLDDIQGEVQIHHAVNDVVVNIEYSRGLEQLLTEAGIANQLFEYQTGGHNITGNSFSQGMARTAEFFIDQ